MLSHLPSHAPNYEPVANGWAKHQAARMRHGVLALTIAKPGIVLAWLDSPKACLTLIEYISRVPTHPHERVVQYKMILKGGSLMQLPDLG